MSSQPENAMDIVERLRLNAEMLKDGYQRNLTELWHGVVVKDAAKDCDEAADEIMRLRSEGRNAWLPIETAPKDGSKVDLWHPTKGRCVNAFWQRQTSVLYEPSCWSNQSWGRIAGATHWMPVPEGPAFPSTERPGVWEDGHDFPV